MLQGRVYIGALILTAGRMASQILGFAGTLVTARLLVPEDFGLMAIALAVFGVASALTELPIAAAVVQMEKVTRTDLNTAWTINAIRGALAMVLMVASSWPLAAAYQEPRLVLLISVLAIYPLLLGLRNPAMELYTRELDFRREAITETSIKVATFVVMTGLAWATRSYWSIAMGLLASGVTAVVMSYWLRPFAPRPSLTGARRFFGFSIWLSLSAIAESLRLTSSTMIIGKLEGQSAVGAYSLANRFSVQLDSILVVPFERSLFSAFSSIQKSKEELRTLYLDTFHAIAAVAVPLCVGVALVASQLIDVVAGSGWELAGPALLYLSLSIAFQALGTPGMSLSIALGKTKWVFILQAIAAAVHIALLATLIYTHGYVGALAAGLISTAVWGVLNIAYAWKTIGVGFGDHFRAMSRMLMSSALMAAFVLTLELGETPESIGKLGELAILSITGGLVYVVSSYLFWAAMGCPDGVEKMVLQQLDKRGWLPGVIAPSIIEKHKPSKTADEKSAAGPRTEPQSVS